MRKITFLLGAGLGFVLGSKAGNGPYGRLETKVRGMKKRPRPGTGDPTSYAPGSDVDVDITTVTISEEVGILGTPGEMIEADGLSVVPGNGDVA